MRHHFTARCMLCGRTAGMVHDGVFRRVAESPPLTVQAGRSLCGYCRGSLYLEADDGPAAFALAALKFGERRQPPAAQRRSVRRRAS